MKETQRTFVSELLKQLDPADRDMSGRIMACLDGLGYAPQRQKNRYFVLVFKNSAVKQTIAKIGLRNGTAFYAIKFYACKTPPEKFIQAVRDAAIKTKSQYRCCNCGACGAAEGERGYSIALQDGETFVRCGAYVVELPAMTGQDVDDFCRLLREQHMYFLMR